MPSNFAVTTELLNIPLFYIFLTTQSFLTIKQLGLPQYRKNTVLSLFRNMTTVAAPRRRKVQIALSVDFDAVSGWLGTGGSTKNTLSDFSAGVFAGNVGVPRILNLFKKIGVADKVTWFIPGHSMETFPIQTKAIVDSGCEIGIHGYAHEVNLDRKESMDNILKPSGGYTSF